MTATCPPFVLGVAPAVSGSDTAARFDGGNDKGSVPDAASLDFGLGDFTVEAWIKTLDSGERAIVAKRSLTLIEPYWALTVTDDSHDNGQIRAAYSDGTIARQAYSTAGVLDGAWHHVVAWYDRDLGITISVDGVSTFTPLAIAADVSNTGTVEIGKAPTHNYFKGDLDEVARTAGSSRPHGSRRIAPQRPRPGRSAPARPRRTPRCGDRRRLRRLLARKHQRDPARGPAITLANDHSCPCGSSHV